MVVFGSLMCIVGTIWLAATLTTTPSLFGAFLLLGGFILAIIGRLAEHGKKSN